MTVIGWIVMMMMFGRIDNACDWLPWDFPKWPISSANHRHYLFSRTPWTQNRLSIGRYSWLYSACLLPPPLCTWHPGHHINIHKWLRRRRLSDLSDRKMKICSSSSRLLFCELSTLEPDNMDLARKLFGDRRDYCMYVVHAMLKYGDLSARLVFCHEYVEFQYTLYCI